MVMHAMNVYVNRYLNGLIYCFLFLFTFFLNNFPFSQVLNVYAYRGIKHPFQGQHLIQNATNSPHITFLIVTVSKTLITNK